MQSCLFTDALTMRASTAKPTASFTTKSGPTRAYAAAPHMMQKQQKSSFLAPQSRQAGRTTHTMNMSMGKNTSQAQPMQMAASNTQIGSQSFSFAEPVSSFNPLTTTTQRIQ
jgi:hypothetical protein